jgi:2-oxoglutarate ferredoxin oxidoreductase subunit delta
LQRRRSVFDRVFEQVPERAAFCVGWFSAGWENASMNGREKNGTVPARFHSWPGGVLMAKAKLKEHRINRDWCKGCGICVAFCPTKVLELDEQDKAAAVRLEDCIACRMCELRCPDLAIEVEVEAQNPKIGSQESENRGQEPE